MGRRKPLTPESPLPRRVVNIATVAWSEDTPRMTPGRTGPPFDLFPPGGEGTVSDLFGPGVPEAADSRELS